MSTPAALAPPGTNASIKATHGPTTQVLTFWLGNDILGMDIRTVREIIQCGPMSAVPLMPDFLRGIINLRGSVVPVIDLNARFGHAPTNIGSKSCIVIFDAVRSGERIELGLLVDAVSEVIKISEDQIEPPPEFGTSLRRDFIHGIGKVGQRFVILLDPDRALDIQEMAALCESAHGGQSV
jgi:purine-binding chemotaxis protein CheW